MTNFSIPEIERRNPIQGAQAPFESINRVSNRIESLVAKTIAIEFSSVALTCYMTSIIYFKAFQYQWPSTFEYASTALLIAVLVLLAAAALKQYNEIQAQPRDRFILSGMVPVLLAFSLFLSLLFVLKMAEWYSRGTFFLQFVGVAIIMLSVRAATFAHIRSSVHSGAIEARRAVLVTANRTDTIDLASLQHLGIRLVGILPFPGPANITRQDHAALTEIRDFVAHCRALKLDDVIFRAVSNDLRQVAVLVDALSELAVTAHVIPIEVTELWASAQIANFGDTVTIQVLRPPLSKFDIALKRGFDTLIASLGLIALAPLLVLACVAVKLSSPGPVFFRQNRNGYNNEIIPVYKLRTMTTVEDGETSKTFTQTKKDDPRLTWVGRILRRTNIDELPQLLNVLRGEMSVVGPRPHPIALNALFQERIGPFSRRHRVKPGLTGWAQVHGLRGETSTLEKMQRRIEHDLYYIDNWSFMLDLRIIIMTLFSRSAYVNAN